MPSGCSESTRDLFRRHDKQAALCPDGHDYGAWGEWHHRRWRKSQQLYWKRFRKCKRCGAVDEQLAESEEERTRKTAQGA